MDASITVQARAGLLYREAGMWHGASKGHLARARVCLNDLEESSKSIWFTELTNIYWKPTISYIGLYSRWGDAVWRKQRPAFVELIFQWWKTDPVNRKNAVCSEKYYGGKSSRGRGWCGLGGGACLTFHREHEIGVWRLREDPQKPGLPKATEGHGNKRHKEISLMISRQKVEVRLWALVVWGMEGERPCQNPAESWGFFSLLEVADPECIESPLCLCAPDNRGMKVKKQSGFTWHNPDLSKEIETVSNHNNFSCK